MGDIDKFIKDDMTAYGDILEKLEFGISDISDFIGDDLKKRDLIRYVDQVREYLDFLRKKRTDVESKGFFSKLLRDDDNEYELIQFKESKKTALIQSHYCCDCKCLKCTSICNMDGCNRCFLRGKVIACDNKTQAIWKFKERNMILTNDVTGEGEEFEVLAIIQDKEYSQYYISMNRISDNQKFIFYYFCNPRGDSYKAIEDVEDFNFVVNTLTQAGL